MADKPPLPAVAGLLISACIAGTGAPSLSSATIVPSATARTVIRASTSPTVAPATAIAVTARANEVLAALKAKDGAKLATLLDPVTGVRFSPYPYVRTDKDVLLSAAEIARGFADPQLRMWGTTSGKGDPIRMTFADYVSSSVYDRDYLARAQISVGQVNGDGNSIDNTKTVYRPRRWWSSISRARRRTE